MLKRELESPERTEISRLAEYFEIEQLRKERMALYVVTAFSAFGVGLLGVLVYMLAGVL